MASENIMKCVNSELTDKQLKTKLYNQQYHKSEKFINNYIKNDVVCQCGKSVKKINLYHHMKT